MKTFAQAWNSARQAGDIYAPDSYASSIYRKDTRVSSSHSTQKQTPIARRSYTPSVPVWSEYAGNSSRKPYTYSPTLARARQSAVKAAVSRAEHILISAKKGHSMNAPVKPHIYQHLIQASERMLQHGYNTRSMKSFKREGRNQVQSQQCSSITISRDGQGNVTVNVHCIFDCLCKNGYEVLTNLFYS